MTQSPRGPHLPPSTHTPPLPLPRRGTPDAAPSPITPPATGGQTPESADRYELLEQLGVPTVASDDFDDLASAVATKTGFLYGFVNLFLERQTFIGLHQPPAGSGYVTVSRTMSRDHGWCPEVVHRRRALPLHDVHASPRFSGNHVVDAVGIRSYFGAPLIHDDGTVLGTVCVIDPEKRPLSDARRLRDIVLNAQAEVMDHIHARPGR